MNYQKIQKEITVSLLNGERWWGHITDDAAWVSYRGYYLVKIPLDEFTLETTGIRGMREISSQSMKGFMEGADSAKLKELTLVSQHKIDGYGAKTIVLELFQTPDTHIDDSIWVNEKFYKLFLPRYKTTKRPKYKFYGTTKLKPVYVKNEKGEMVGIIMPLNH